MLQEQEDIVIDFAEETERAQVSILMQASHEVQVVQNKLRQKGYMTCEECGDDIPEDRRKAYPSARTCIPCQTWLEKHFARAY